MLTGLAALAALGFATPAICPDVADYATWAPSADQAWDYRDPRVTLIGAEHSRDPDHAQFPRIAAAFAAAKPTMVLFEGPQRGTKANVDAAIRESGESGYLRLLAAQAGVAARSFEPSPPEQVKMLLTDFPIDQVMLFFVTREAARLRDREGVTGAALDSAVAKMLEKIAAMEGAIGRPLAFSDLAGLEAAFARYWPGLDWKSADARWFSPTADDAQTGGRFFGAINRADSSNRNRHLLRQLVEAVEKGERPFVVVGRNHVPMIAPALDCRLSALSPSRAESPPPRSPR